MSMMKNFRKAMVPSFFVTMGKLADGTLTVAARAVEEWEANSEADASLRKQEHKLAQEQRKLDIKISASEFKIEADKAALAIQLEEANHAVQRLEKEFSVKVRTTALLMIQYPDKAEALKAKLVAHKAMMEQALQLVADLSNVDVESETTDELSFSPTFKFDPDDL